MNGEHFKLDKLKSNCEFLIKYCSNYDNEWSKYLIENCEQLIKSANYIDGIAYELTFEQMPVNGFIAFLKIITSYTSKLVKQVEKRNKIDLNLIKLFKLINAYKIRVELAHQNLLDEKDNKLNKNSIITYVDNFSNKEFYDLIHSNEDILPISLSIYPGFWLPKDVQRCLKFFNFLFAIAFKLPFSLSSIYSSKNMGKYCYKAFKNANVNYPFDIWHQTEGWFISRFVNYCSNIRVPVKSVSLKIPKQKRFRLNYKGELFDFERMNEDELNSYLNDKEEEYRQNCPGLRHRNEETIKCRYSFITSKEKIKESLNQIKKNKQTEPNFKALKYHSERKSINKPILNYLNKVNELNIYEPIGLIDNKLNEIQNKNKKKTKTKKKIKNPKYDGPNYNNLLSSTTTDENEFKDIPLNNPPISESINVNNEQFKFNNEKAILIYLHGGGFFTQSPKSCELWLRKIVNQLGGIPILGIHYSLTVPFPIPVQEILDVYLWLLSGGEDVKEILGFNPEKIYITGDSAGGYFTLVVTILINELNKKIGLNNENMYSIPLPSSIILEYPVVELKTMSPSRTLSTLEPLIAFHPLMVVISLYACSKASNGDFKNNKNDELKRLEEENKHLFNDDEYKENIKEFEKYQNNDRAPWFQCDYPTYRSRAKYIKSFFNHPLISPLIYKNFEELKSVNLYSLTGEFDFLVDDSIEISNLWKGNVCLDLLENTMHGYLHFGNLSEDCRESAVLAVRRLQEACGLF